jgi:hypothetical protein
MNPHVEIKDECQGYKATGCRIDKGHREPREETRGMNTMAGERVRFQGLQCEKNETIRFQAAEVLCAAFRNVIKDSRRS